MARVLPYSLNREKLNAGNMNETKMVLASISLTTLKFNSVKSQQ